MYAVFVVLILILSLTTYISILTLIPIVYSTLLLISHIFTDRWAYKDVGPAFIRQSYEYKKSWYELYSRN